MSRDLQRTIADLRWQMARQMTEHDGTRVSQAASAAADDSPRLRKYDSASSITLGAIAHQLSISSKEGRLAYDLRSIIQVLSHIKAKFDWQCSVWLTRMHEVRGATHLWF